MFCDFDKSLQWPAKNCNTQHLRAKIAKRRINIFDQLIIALKEIQRTSFERNQVEESIFLEKTELPVWICLIYLVKNIWISDFCQKYLFWEKIG